MRAHGMATPVGHVCAAPPISVIGDVSGPSPQISGERLVGSVDLWKFLLPPPPSFSLEVTFAPLLTHALPLLSCCLGLFVALACAVAPAQCAMSSLSVAVRRRTCSLLSRVMTLEYLIFGDKHPKKRVRVRVRVRAVDRTWSPAPTLKRLFSVGPLMPFLSSNHSPRQTAWRHRRPRRP